MEKIMLNNYVEMPMLGIGTFMMSPEEAYDSVSEALRVGYRLIDTANAYCNERAIGRAIKDSGIPREEIFISSKLWPSEYENPNCIDETLERLGVDYIDLLMLHQPVGEYVGAYKMMEDAFIEGKIKALGISNFELEEQEILFNNCRILPQIVQAEAHPYFTQNELRRVLNVKDIVLMSWFPLGHGDPELLNEPVFKEIGDKYGKDPVQVILRWHNRLGFVTIPSSTNAEHIRSNFNIFDFELSDEDMLKIHEINKNEKYYERSVDSLIGFLQHVPDYEK